MNRMRLWVSAAIIACIILIVFALSVPHTRDVEVKSAASTTTNVSVVTVHDIFKKGVHTISGSIDVSNACTPVSASATLVGTASSTESILVAITLQVDPGICLQVPTSVSFRTTLTAPARLPIDVTVNGTPASTTPS
jgi:hypothetical protein